MIVCLPAVLSAHNFDPTLANVADDMVLLTDPIACGDSLEGVITPSDQLAKLLDADRRYRSFKYWDKVRVGGSESPITGQGFNAVKFDPRKPARTIRRTDGNLGMHGAMYWGERRRFSLPEFKRFGSFPDGVHVSRRFRGWDQADRQLRSAAVHDGDRRACAAANPRVPLVGLNERKVRISF